MNNTIKRIVEETLARERAGLIPDYGASNSRTTVKLSVYTPCGHEGAIIEYCYTCNGEAKHVRECGYEENTTGKCTRGYVSSKVWSCARCEHHTHNTKRV